MTQARHSPIRPHRPRPRPPTRTTTPRVVVYARISSDDDLDRQGVTRQLDDCRRHAEREGWQIVAELEDDDVSASEHSTKFRPGYDALVRMVQAEQADVVLCWHLDRLYRRPAELEQFLPLIDRHRVRLVTTDNTEISPGEGALVARIRTAVAAEEARKIRIRTRRKKLEDAVQGKKHGRTPYGWNNDGTPKPGEMEFVAELTERLLAGDSLKGIARDWNARKVPVPFLKQRVKAPDGTWLRDAEGKVVRERHERPWDSEGLRALVRRASNAGLREFTDADGKRELTDGYWQPIVTQDQWRSVMGLLDSRHRPQPTQKYLLSGLVDCGLPECGGKASGTWRLSRHRSRRDYRNQVYRCTTCIRVSVDSAFLDAAVETATIERLQGEDVARLIGSAQAEAARAAADHAQALRERRKTIARLVANGSLTETDAVEALAELNPQLRAADAEADRLSAGRSSALHGLTGPEAEQRWAELDRDRKRAVISILWKITIRPRDKEHWATEHRVSITSK
jgi:site-specific DNA recombinase